MTIQQMREKRQAHAKEMRNLHEKHTGSAWGEEQQKRYDELDREIEQIDASIAREQKVLDIEAANAHRTQAIVDGRGVSADEAHEIEARETSILNTWMRKGQHGLSREDSEFLARREAQIRATMSTTTGSEGGYTVPKLFSSQLIESLKAFGGVRANANVIQTASGAAFDFPTTDGTAETGELVAQNASVTGADPVFGVKTLNAYKYSSKGVAVPFELLQDTAIDLEGFIRARLAERIARITASHFATGNGTTQPEGVVTASTVGKAGATGQTTAVTVDDLIDLQHSVDPAYRAAGVCKFAMNDSTLKAIKKLKDSQNRPLWLAGLDVKEPDTILGSPYFVDQGIAAMAANAKSILYGDFSKYFVRDVMQVTLFRMEDSTYINKGQVGFVAFYRGDGKLMDTGAIKHYANSAT